MNLRTGAATTLVTCFALCTGTQSLPARVVNNYVKGVNDRADSYGTGSGGGDPTRGVAPGGRDPVTGAMSQTPAASGGAATGCGAGCSGGGKTGGDGSGGVSANAVGCDGGGGTGPQPAPGSTTAYSVASAFGMAVWQVSEGAINLWLYDQPLAYSPGLGPPLSFSLAFKQRGAPLVASNIYSVGTNWTCSWLSYVEDDGVGSQATVWINTGGQIIYAPPNGSAMEYYTHTSMLRQTNGSGLTGFVRSFPDGATDYYQCVPAHVRLPDGNIPVFLSARTDASGRTNVLFTYSEQQVNSAWRLRLTSVTDADGRASSLSYANSDPSLITSVTDPFGRSAVLQYDSTGRLTNVTDTAGLSSSVTYDSRNWVTNLTTPYGVTTFQHVDNGFTNSNGTYNTNIIRAVRIIDPVGATNIYMLRNYSSFVSRPPTPYVNGPLFDSNVEYRNSFHWGPRQAAGLPVNMTNYVASDYVKARMRHWLFASTNSTGTSLSQTISFQVEPSPDGVNPGQATWYAYDGMRYANFEGTNSLPSFAGRVLPDTTTWYADYQRDAWGRATNVIDTYSAGYGQTPQPRSRQAIYSGSDMVTVIGPQGETLAGYAYSNHLPLRATNAVGDVTLYTWDVQGRLTSVKTPAGLTTTNLYFSTGAYTNFIQTAIDLETSRTNWLTYTNNLLYTRTDERGLTTTNLHDNLNRLTNSANAMGAISYLYNKLDVVQVKDRMGFTTSFAYDAVRRRTAETNALGRATLYNYCACDALDSIRDVAGNYTYFTYDNAGRRTQTAYPDSYTVNYSYDWLGELTNSTDSAGVAVVNWFNNQGQLYAVLDVSGLRSTLAFDAEDRVTNSWDANGVSIAMTYDNLGRLLTRTYPDSGVESFGYSARGLVAHTNQLGYTTHYGYDPARRKIAGTNANNEIVLYTNNAAGDVLSLTDGKNQTTCWNYDQYGRVTNKLDQAGTVILKYSYDGNSRLTNRWSTAKGNTAYAYDPVGNLTNIAYPTSGTVRFAYDAMNRLTNMVDAAGTTRYTYDAVGQLLTEGGVFTSDTITHTYANRERVAQSLQQPTGSWTNGFGWDLAGRLTNVTSRAGAFGYGYSALDGNFSGRLVQRLGLPSGAYVTNSYDPVARVLGTVLKSSGGGTLDSALYGYNEGNQRTAYTNAAGTYVSYAYDPIGQVTAGISSTPSENRGYAYDAAWNLSCRTNNGASCNFWCDCKNQLTNTATLGLAYDANGNLTNQVTDAYGDFMAYAYDDENRLIDVQNLSIAYETVFIYDGLGRLRIRQEYAGGAQMRPLGPTGWMPLVNVVNYVYDGWRVIQERDSNNVPTVSYTRGLDLSGSLEGAGGIGGLLARSSGYSSGNWTSHAYYHADGNGNITCLVDTNQTLVASYRYDPFGNTLSQSGTLANANVYRFSSKECHTNSLMYYYGYRLYDPNLQRWVNRDPINELGFDLLNYPRSARRSFCGHDFTFLRNASTCLVDPLGLRVYFGKGCKGSDAKQMMNNFLARCKIAQKNNCFKCLSPDGKANMNTACDPNKFVDVVVDCEDKSATGCQATPGKGGTGCGWTDSAPDPDFPGKTVVHVCMGMDAATGCSDTGCTLLHELAHAVGGVGPDSQDSRAYDIEKCAGCQ